jgi:hypothetical protein
VKKSKIGIAVGLSVTLSALLSVNIAHAENQFRMAFSSSNEGIEIVDSPLFFKDVSPSKQAEYDDEWLTFLRTEAGQDIPSIDDLNYSNLTLSLGNKSLENIALPSGPLNIQTPYTLNFSNNNLTHLNFLRTTEIFRNIASFNNNALNNVNGLLNVEETSASLLLNDNQLQQVLGLKKLTRVDGNFNLSKNPELTSLEGMEQLEHIRYSLALRNNPALVDLTGISNISYVGISINLDDVSQYTATPTANSTLCQSLFLGDVRIVDFDSQVVKFADFCSDVEPWISFLHSHEQLTNLSSMAQWENKGGKVSFANEQLTNEDIPSVPIESDFISFLNFNANKLSNVDFLSNIERSDDGIYFNGSPELQNIDGLSSLTSVKSLYILSAPHLEHVDGLLSLTSAHTLSLSNNDSMANVDGLSSLVSVEYLYLYKNNALAHLDGLSSLVSLTRLNLWENDSLTSIDGFSSIVSADEINITDNASLTNLDGLSSLVSAEKIHLDNNTSLTNVDGLSSLANVYNLNLEHNPSLKNINGLSSFSQLRGRLLIHDNPSLTDISGLSSIKGAKIYIDEPSQYSVKPLVGSPFCEAFRLEELIVKIKVDYAIGRSVNYSELCQ